jgi:hypothetical protein
MIRDPSMGRGVALPLYKRGVERDRFERALAWLQKDVEQILAVRGISYDRQKGMLFNLRQLYACEMCPKMNS